MSHRRDLQSLTQMAIGTGPSADGPVPRHAQDEFFRKNSEGLNSEAGPC